MGIRGRLGFSTLCLFIGGICAQLGTSDEAESTKPLSAYQIESQYGPEVAVLNPIYPKDGKFEFTLGANYSPLSSLYDYYGVSLGAIYHLSRRHAIEPVWFQYNFGDMSSFAQTEIADKTTAQKSTLGVDFPRMIVSSSYIFTPYYSKMHLTDLSVVHLDLYAIVGVAAVNTETILLDGTTGSSNWRYGGDLGIGVRVLMRDRWAVRVEIRDFIHQATQIGAGDITNDMQMTAGFSMFLGQFPDYTHL